MLRCSKCKHLYNDETQKFCTSDGTRLLPVDQPFGQTEEKIAARRTPTGELLFETFISPPTSSTIKRIDSPNKKPSYQMFGLHSANVPNQSPENKATNGFHSFDYLIVRDETKIEQNQSVPMFDRTSGSKPLDRGEHEKKSKFGPSFILLCLLSALIFLTCLAFVASYFFSEQQKSPALPVSRQANAALNLPDEKEITSLTVSDGRFVLRKTI